MNLRRCRIILFLLITSILTGTALSSSAQENWHDILKLSLEADSQVNFEGIKEIQIHTPQGKLYLLERVIYQKPDFMYIEYLEPAQIKGRIVIDDGKRKVEYFPKKGEIKVFPSQNCPQIEARRKKLLNILLANLDISKFSQEKMLGREVYILELSSRDLMTPSLRLWIDKQTYLPLRREKYSPRGEIVSFFRYLEAEFNKHFSREQLLSKIPQLPSFEEEPPSYYTKKEIIEKVNFPVSFPSYLPAGYLFQGAQIQGERNSVKLIYTDGLDVIVLFQRPRVNIAMREHRWMDFGDIRVRYRTGAYGNILVWDKKGVTFILMGQVPLEELKKIAESVK